MRGAQAGGRAEPQRLRNPPFIAAQDIGAHTDAAGLPRIFRKLRRQPEQGHLTGAGRRIDVGVGGKGQRSSNRPRLAPPDAIEKGEGVGADDGRQILVAQRQAKVVGRPAVLAGLEIGEREVEAHPRQVGIAGQHGAEAGDGGLPVAPPERDGAMQEVEVVDVSLAGLDTLEQEFRIVQFALHQRRPGGFD